MDDKLILPIEFDVNNPQLQQEINDAKKAISGVGQTVDAVESQVNKNLHDIASTVAIVETSFNELNKDIAGLDNTIENSFDPKAINDFIIRIQQLENQIEELNRKGIKPNIPDDGLDPLNDKVKKTKSSFNGLQNSINQISRELPAFTYSAQTGFMAISNNLPILFDEIGNIKKQNDALVASGQKAVPMWKQLSGAIFGWGTLLSIGVTLMTVYGKEIGEWIVGLFKGKDALAALKKEQAEFNSIRLKGTQDAQKEITSLKSIYEATQNTNLSLKERNKAVDHLQSKFPAYFKNMTNEAILAGKAKGAYDQLTQSIIAAAQARAYENKISEISSKILENNDKVTEKSSSITDAQRQAMNIDRATINSGGTMMFTTGGSDAYQTIEEIKTINKETADLTKTIDRYKTAISNLVEINGVGVVTGDVGGTKGTEGAKKTLDNYKNLLSEITELDAEYARQIFDSDKVEMLALEDKFYKIREKIEEFNKDKENKIKINIGDLDPIQENAKNNLLFSQQTSRLQKQFDEEYKVFQEYEELRKSTTEQYANERFANQLEAIKSFEQRLNTELSKIDPKTTNVLEIKRREDLMKIVVDMQRKTQAEEDKLFVEALSKYADYHQKRAKIIEDAEKEITKLTKEGRLNEADNARKQRNDSLIELGKSEIEASEAYKTVLNTIDKSSKAMMVNAFKTGKETVYSLVDGLKDATDSEKAKLKKLFGEFFDKGISAANLDKGDYINNLVDGFGELAVVATQFDSSLGNSLNTISSMINTVSQLSSAIGEFKNSDLLKGVGQSLGTFGAFAGVVGGVTSYFAQKQAEEQQKIYDQANHSTQLQLKATEAITRALQKQVELINEIYGAERLEKYNTTLKEIQGGWSKLNNELGTKYKLSENKEIDDLITKLNNGLSWEEITKKMNMDDLVKTYNRLNDIVKGKYGGKFSPISDDIKAAQQELIKLEQIANSGKADENTLNLINQLRNQIDLYNEVANKLREETTGNTFATILNDVKNLFKTNGEDSAEAWAKSFDSIMENYILQKFSREYLEKALQDWYVMLDQYAISGGSIDEAEKKALQDAYNKIQQDGQKRVDQIKDAMNFNPDYSSSSNSSLKSEGIARVSEQTGASIDGTLRANLDVNKRNLIVSERALEFHIKSGEILAQQLKHQAAIEANTAETVKRLDTAIVELKVISKGVGGKYGL